MCIGLMKNFYLTKETKKKLVVTVRGVLSCEGVVRSVFLDRNVNWENHKECFVKC